MNDPRIRNCAARAGTSSPAGRAAARFHLHRVRQRRGRGLHRLARRPVTAHWRVPDPAAVDVILSARRVGPGGKAYGLDMTDEMLALAEENKRRSGLANVEF